MWGARGTAISLVVLLALVGAVAYGQTTHAQYVQQVNPICKQISHQGKKRLDQIRPTGNRLRDFIRKTSVFAKLLGQAARRLEAVEPAVEDQAAVKSWIAGIRQEKRVTERYVRLLKHARFSQAQSVARKYDHVRKATDAKARKLGLNACVSSTR
jgi:hypothetical protein